MLRTGYRQFILVIIALAVGGKALTGRTRQSPAPSADAAGMQFVRITPGEFMMGCSAGDKDCPAPEKPARRVRITRGFEIGRYEVTQAEWQAVMGSNPSHFLGDNLPVDQVSWNDVQQFIEKMNARNDGYRYRLPTEAEWEYAARAGSTTATAGELDKVAWVAENSQKTPHPVGQKQPNAWGLYDMIGNMSEWVQDWWKLDYYSTGPTDDPPGPATGSHRVLRGGSWSATPLQARVSYRIQMETSEGNATMGFRCARDAR